MADNNMVFSVKDRHMIENDDFWNGFVSTLLQHFPDLRILYSPHLAKGNYLAVGEIQKLLDECLKRQT